MERGAGGADGVAVEDLLDSGETLALVGDLVGRGEHRRGVDAERVRGEGLQLLAEDDGVGASGLHELDLLRGERRRDVHDLVAVGVEQFPGAGVDREDRTGIDRVGLFENRFTVVVDDELAVGVELGDPVLEVEADSAGDADGGEKDRGNAVRAADDRGVVDERHVLAGLLADPEGDVVHAGHTRRTHAHRALLRNQQHALVGVGGLEVEQRLLLFLVVLEHALAVQLPVGTGVGIGAGGEQVGGDVAHAGDEGHDLDLFVDVGELGEELGVCVALQYLGGERVATLVRFGQAGHVRFVEEDLGREHIGGGSGRVVVVTEQEVEQDCNRGAALHVRKLLERRLDRDAIDGASTGDHILEHGGLEAGSTRGAGEHVVDEEVEAVGPVGAVGVGHVRNDLGQQAGAVDRLRVEPVRLPVLDLVQIVVVQAHDVGLAFAAAVVGNPRKRGPSYLVLKLYWTDVAACSAVDTVGDHTGVGGGRIVRSSAVPSRPLTSAVIWAAV